MLSFTSKIKNTFHKMLDNFLNIKNSKLLKGKMF